MIRHAIGIFAVSQAFACAQTDLAVEAPEASRPTAPVVSSADPAWARLGRSCARHEPVWNPPVDPGASSLEHGRDVQWAAIAREIPGGFAGLYLDNSRPVVLLTDTLQKAPALQALAARTTRPDIDVRGARVIQARWDFAQLHDWWAYITAQRILFQGLTTSDINERDNRLVYGFQDSTSIRAAESRIERLQLPCYLLAFVVEKPVIFRR